jgi:indole-3-glycerol phosphate synthase
MDLLQRIMAERTAAARTARRRVPLRALRALAQTRPHHSLAARLAAGSGACIIAEMKKASPSAGLLRPDYDPAALAQAYEAAGATGISVLTEPRHFQGAGAHLRAARAVTALPILRKDFIGDEYWIAEAAAWGADVVLLIAAALEPARLHALYEAALGYGLEVLVEAHTEPEVDAALALPRAIVGVNSRDLRTLVTHLDTARRLAPRIPAERLSVAESGIKTRAEIEDLAARGYRGFLIGASILSAPDAATKLRQLAGARRADAVLPRR